MEAIGALALLVTLIAGGIGAAGLLARLFGVHFDSGIVTRCDCDDCQRDRDFRRRQRH